MRKASILNETTDGKADGLVRTLRLWKTLGQADKVAATFKRRSSVIMRRAGQRKRP